MTTTKSDRLVVIPKLDGLSITNGHVMTYVAELITPMFGGGVASKTPDQVQLFRGRSFKHQLRFWWRRLAQYGQLPGQHGSRWFLEELYAQERLRFGGLDGKGKSVPSAVRVALTHQPGKRPIQICDVQQYPKVGYALFSARPKRGERGVRCLVAEGELFRIAISVNDSKWVEELRTTMRHWAHIGGLGGRSSRGLGAVAVKENGALLEPPTRGELSAIDITVAEVPDTFSDPLIAWEQAVERLRFFRQGHSPFGVIKSNSLTKPAPRDVDQSVRPTGTISGDPSFWKYRPGRNKWWDANSVRRLANFSSALGERETLFPRASFGLPIIGEQLNDVHDPDRHVSEGKFQIHPWIDGKKKGERMASPLWLRPVILTSANDSLPNRAPQFKAAAFLFVDQAEASLSSKVHVSFVPDTRRKKWRTDNGRPEIKMERDDVGQGQTIWPSDALGRSEISRRVEPIALLGGGQNDPLRAFMYFFSAQHQARS